MKLPLLVGLLWVWMPQVGQAQALPRLEIRTDGAVPVETKEVYVPAAIGVTAGEGPAFLRTGIRLHGNSTLGFPKTSFKLKLDEKQPLLGMPAEKEWVLLANYSDKTLLRNHLALELHRSLGRYSPRNRFVELTLNGNFLGTYLVTEQIEISPQRVNVPKLSPGDTGEALTGGYLFEIYHHPQGPLSWENEHGTTFNLKAPKEPSAAQADYARRYLQETDAAIFSAAFTDPARGYERYLDVDQFLDWYLVNELFRNQDSGNFASIYLHKDRGGKLAMGPAWDFDIAAGNVDYDENFLTDGWWVRVRSPWFARLFEDPAFEARMRHRWAEVRGKQVEALFRRIDEMAARLDEAQARNFARWPILNEKVWPNYVVMGSYAGEVAYLRDWLRKRVRWLDRQWIGTPAN